jgi:hypothetical protein
MDQYENKHNYNLIFQSSYAELKKYYNSFNNETSSLREHHTKILKRLKNRDYNQFKVQNQLIQLSENMLIFAIYKLISSLRNEPTLNFVIDRNFTKPYLYLPFEMKGYPDVKQIVIVAKPIVKDYLILNEEPIYELGLVDGCSQPVYINALGYDKSTHTAYDPYEVIGEIYRLRSISNNFKIESHMMKF